MIQQNKTVLRALSANNSPRQAERTVEQRNRHHDIDGFLILLKESLKCCPGEEPCKIADGACERKKYADKQKRPERLVVWQHIARQCSQACEHNLYIRQVNDEPCEEIAVFICFFCFLPFTGSKDMHAQIYEVRCSNPCKDTDRTSENSAQEICDQYRANGNHPEAGKQTSPLFERLPPAIPHRSVQGAQVCRSRGDAGDKTIV